MLIDKKIKNSLVINIQKFKPFKDYFKNQNFSNIYLISFRSRKCAVLFLQ